MGHATTTEAEPTETGLIEPPEPGLHPGVPFSDYLRWDAANCSTLKALKRRAPQYARYKMEYPDDQEEEKHWAIFGRLVHLLCTEGKKAAKKEFYILPETYKNAKGETKPWNGNATVCKEKIADARAGGKEIIKKNGTATKPGAQQAIDMADSVLAHPRIARLLSLASREVSMVWTEPRTGVLCKGRFDLWIPGECSPADLKTTQIAKATPDQPTFWNDAFRLKYHWQVAMYLDGVRALGLVPEDERPRFLLIAVEKERGGKETPKHLVNTFDIYDDPGSDSFDFIDRGRRHYMTELEIYRQCKESGEWPGYGDESKPMMLPIWALNQLIEERKLNPRG